MAKKKKKSIAPLMSPEKYIKTRARKLPLGKTYISRNGAMGGVYAIVVTRVHPGGKITAGVYLVDMYCLGVKDSYYSFSLDSDVFLEKLYSMGIDFEEADYAEAHNLIYGALEYAEEAGIDPAREFKITEYILEPDDESIPLMEFEFGHDGVRELVIGPDYREMKYIPLLERNVPGEFIVTGFTERYYNDDSEKNVSYEATTGNDNPRSFNFDFHPFPHAPYPEDLEEVRHMELLDIFYPLEGELDITLDAAQIATIRSVPRDELLADLRIIVGYELGQSEAEIEEDGEYNRDFSVMYHICAILAETGGSDTKDLVETIMQQSYYWHEVYLGDFGMELMHSVLANAFEDSPEELARMVVEQGYAAHSRVTMLFSLECIALWNPSVRQRVEKVLHDLAEHILHGDGSDLPLLNDYTIGVLSDTMTGLLMKQDLPLIKEMHERNLINKKVFGDYEAQVKEMLRLEKGVDYIETRHTTLEQIYETYK